MGERILVFDLELSCWLGRPPEGMRSDIIEIGFCVLDMNTTGITDRNSLIIKPANSNISKFCAGLTGITQEMVDQDGITLKEACAILSGHAKHTSLSAAWGKFDPRSLKKDCHHYGVEYPLTSDHSNAQKTFRTKLGRKDETSVRKALAHLGRQFDGRQHRAVDDAYNTAVILSDILCGALEQPHGPQ